MISKLIFKKKLANILILVTAYFLCVIHGSSWWLHITMLSDFIIGYVPLQEV
jgi:hypothetical protein